MSRASPTKPVLHGSEHNVAGNDPISDLVTHASRHLAGGADKLSGALVLIANDETDSAETTSSTSETTLKTISLPANSYSKILIEADVISRFEADLSSRCDFTWRIKYNGVTQKTFVVRIIASSTSGIDSGGRYVTHLSYIMSGGQASAANVTITGQMTVSNAAAGILVHNVRLWGII